MTRFPIAFIVVISQLAGAALAAALLLGPAAGAQEPAVTGALLLGLAACLGVLALLSACWTNLPQRWAAGAAAYPFVTGLMLIVLDPGEAVMDALGWLWPPLLLVLIVWMFARARTQLRSRSGSPLVYGMFTLLALASLGGGYETVREAQDRRQYPAPTPLIHVTGHGIYLSCIGTGSPAVILESGLGAASSSWGLIAPMVAKETRVCVYDRAGRGWSESAPGRRDGWAIAADLHDVLNARVGGPYVLVGHSSGAQYVRIFAGQYPQQVAGVVLLDAQPTDAFTGLPNYPAFYRNFRLASALFPTLARMGVARAIIHHVDFEDLPPHARELERVNNSAARQYRSLRDELAELPTALTQADAFPGLGHLPLVVVTAGRDTQEGWLTLQDALPALSTNSTHLVLANATHSSLLDDEHDATAVSEAIRKIVDTVRHAAPATGD